MDPQKMPPYTYSLQWKQNDWHRLAHVFTWRTQTEYFLVHNKAKSSMSPLWTWEIKAQDCQPISSNTIWCSTTHIVWNAPHTHFHMVENHHHTVNTHPTPQHSWVSLLCRSFTQEGARFSYNSVTSATRILTCNVTLIQHTVSKSSTF
jgi:hypothetical protein